jgi:hypothetical protein
MGSAFTCATVAMQRSRPGCFDQMYPQKSAFPTFTSTSRFPASSKTFSPTR